MNFLRMYFVQRAQRKQQEEREAKEQYAKTIAAGIAEEQQWLENKRNYHEWCLSHPVEARLDALERKVKKLKHRQHSHGCDDEGFPF